MAETEDIPNKKIGVHSLEGTQGVQFTQGMMDKDDSRGTITAYFSGGIDDYELNLRDNQEHFPAELNGVPLRYVTTKMLEGGHGIVVARYRHKDNRPRRDKNPAFFDQANFQVGKQTVQLWNAPDSITVLNRHMGKPAQRAIQATTITITMSGFEWQSSMPAKAKSGFSTKGSVNSNAYSCAGHSFPAGSLLNVGTQIRHSKASGYSRWDWSHVVMYRKVPTTERGNAVYWAKSLLTDEGLPELIDIYPASHWPDFNV